MVVDHIQQDGDPAEVTGVNERLEPVRPSITDILDRKGLGGVVTPTIIAGELGNGMTSTALTPRLFK